MTFSLFSIIHPRRSKPAVKTLVCVHWGSLNWEATGLCGKFLDVGLHPGLSSPKIFTPLVTLPRGTGEPSGGIHTQLGESVDTSGQETHTGSWKHLLEVTQQELDADIYFSAVCSWLSEGISWTLYWPEQSQSSMKHYGPPRHYFATMCECVCECVFRWSCCPLAVTLMEAKARRYFKRTISLLVLILDAGHPFYQINKVTLGKPCFLLKG